MPYLSKKRVWTSQPQQVTRLKSEYYADSALCFPLGVGNGGRNLAQNNTGLILPAQSPIIAPTPIGMGETAGSTEAPYYSASVIKPVASSKSDGTGAFTLLIALTAKSEATRTYPFTIRNPNTPYNIIALYLNGYNDLNGSTSYNNPGTICPYTVEGVSTPIRVDGILTSEMKPYVILFCRDEAGNNEFWLDGNLVGTSSGAIRAVQNGAAQSTAIGGVGYVTGFTNSGHISLVYAANKRLNDPAAISKNPWQIFKKQNKRIWIPSAGGGSSTNLIIQDSTHSLLSDNLDLSTSLLLTIQDSTHSLTSDSLILSTDWLLTIQDSIHNLTSDNLILNTTGSTDLTIQEATHSVTSDNLLITTEWLLDIASAAHALTSDNLDLSTALSIVIQNAIHSHTSDNIVLDTSDTTLLTIQDAVHSHTADNLDLTLDTWLVIANAVHNHLADNIDLGTELTLTIQDSTHNLTSDIIILSIPSTGSCPTVEEIVAAIMIQIEAKNYLTLPQFLSFK